jgi:hypothetical protein
MTTFHTADCPTRNPRFTASLNLVSIVVPMAGRCYEVVTSLQLCLASKGRTLTLTQ